MVGMTRPRLIGLILIQAFSYSIPAIVFGLPLSRIISYGLTLFLEDLTLVPLNDDLTPVAIVLAIVAGLLIPVMSAIVPIQAALNKNIWDAVDTKRSKTKAVKFKLGLFVFCDL